MLCCDWLLPGVRAPVLVPRLFVIGHKHHRRIRFTVVSEPPEEEEQERECEDVGMAFLRIPDILEKQRDVTEERLSVLDVEDSSEVVGTLTVSMECLEALRSIMEEEETAISSL
ncbi:protein fantom isoform X2 [Pelmatolapia mariae]|uniref:protein fantom isoform X2 n=1 Tax=Pelmatolapia mariae TaxID=158779 RepID=UPI002FE5B4D7